MISHSARKHTVNGPYDFTWARRIRHAFRLIVVLAFVFTFAMWFSESYLRYDTSETQYRMALTLHPAQARPILRTVVRREEAVNEQPPARYVEALAQVEEPHNVLEQYELAYRLNPRNASLIINYGTVLYENEQYEEARERFREAGVNPPRNVLPRYLEAAALAAGLQADADPTDLIALITRANASEDPVLFPEPLWHESLPTHGRRHLELRREIARRMTEPLLDCVDMIIARAKEDMEQGALRDWDNWLENIAIMGVRLMGEGEEDSPPTTLQLTAALTIQRDAEQLRAALVEKKGGVVPSSLHESLARYDEALKALKTFDGGYHQLLTLQSFRLALPFTLLMEAAFCFLFFYALGWFLHHLGSGGKSARAVPHIWIGKALPVMGMLVMLALLATLMVMHNTRTHTPWEAHIPLLWRSMLAALLVVGVAYPPLVAKVGNMFERIRENENGSKEPASTPGTVARVRQYTGVYGCLLRRYMGILIGGLVIVVCLWLLTYRIAYDVYPFQMELIASSVGMDTATLIDEVQRYLAAP